MLLTITSIILTAVSGYLTWVAQQSYKNKDITKNALKILMKKELHDIHEECMNKGSINSETLGEFIEIYEIYHACGGNGQGTVWKNDLERLRRE